MQLAQARVGALVLSRDGTSEGFPFEPLPLPVEVCDLGFGLIGIRRLFQRRHPRGFGLAVCFIERFLTARRAKELGGETKSKNETNEAQVRLQNLSY